MNFFRKNSKVRFLCTIPGALETHPITVGSKLRPKWLIHAVKQYVNNKSNVAFENSLNGNRSIAKCHGIKELFRKTWIMYAWQDICLDVRNDGSFRWVTPINQKEITGYDYVMHHNKDSFSGCPHMKEQIPIIKITSPWFVELPKGYSLLQIPVPYPSHNDFVAATGVLNTDFGYLELNVQLFINRRGIFTIEAGTPLAMYMLVKDNNVGTELCYATQAEIEKLKAQRNILGTKFKTNYKETKENIKNLFKNNG